MQKAEHICRAVLDFMAEYIESSTDVLEVAAGTGFLGCALAYSFKNVTSGYLSPEMIIVAQTKKTVPASDKDIIENNNVQLVKYKQMKGVMPFTSAAAQKQAGKTRSNKDHGPT